MSFDLFNYSVSVLGYKTEKVMYGMTVAWAMQVDYDKIVLLIGEQSQTGKALCKGSYIGISCLNVNQKDIATNFGFNHSEEVDKYQNISYTIDKTAILIDDATVIMKATIIDIIHLEGIENDLLVYAKVNESFKTGNAYLTTNMYNNI